MLYGGDTAAANYALDYLINQDVDTIYWFADFADRIDKGSIEEVEKDLRRNRVKLIAHNFMGKPVRADVKEMAEKTGGTTIEVVPGKN
jgi:hypothetical protein